MHCEATPATSKVSLRDVPPQAGCMLPCMASLAFSHNVTRLLTLFSQHTNCTVRWRNNTLCVAVHTTHVGYQVVDACPGVSAATTDGCLSVCSYPTTLGPRLSQLVHDPFKLIHLCSFQVRTILHSQSTTLFSKSTRGGLIGALCIVSYFLHKTCILPPTALFCQQGKVFSVCIAPSS